MEDSERTLMDEKMLLELVPALQDSDDSRVEGAPKKRRITRACDRCHRSGIRCSPGTQEGVCAPCTSYGSRCTYDRPIKRRGPAPKMHDASDTTPASTREPHGPWRYCEIAPHSVLVQLAEFYEAVIWPIQAYYHYPTFLRRIESRLYTRSRPFFTDLMSTCALTTARIRDGATCPTHPVTAEMCSVSSEEFYHAALSAFPPDLTHALDFEYKRAKNLMALLCIQYGDTQGIQRHVGDYCTMTAMDGSHLESRWPQNLNQVEIQERRRLFWSAYQLDVYASCTWGSTARHRESETTVLYPAEVVSDADITPTSVSTSPESWWRGWNFVTDLYRILEHAIEGVRMRRIQGEDAGPGWQGGQGGPVSALFNRGVGPSNADILQVVGEMYAELPESLRTVKPLGEDEELNRFGFQATNIIITLQTVKMVVAGSGTNSVSQRCEIAGMLLDAMSNVPTAYIYAGSAPVLHHLAGIGHLLGSVIHKPLSQWTYLQVRNCLLSMADMLSGLESVLSRTTGIAQRLRDHIGRIDKYMADAAKERAGRGVQHVAAPWNAAPVSTVRTNKHEETPRAKVNGNVKESSRASISELPSASTSLAIDPGLDLLLPNLPLDPQPLPGVQENGLSSIPDLTGTGLTPFVDSRTPASDGVPGVVLPNDIFADWPFDLGGGAFDFLGDWGQSTTMRPAFGDPAGDASLADILGQPDFGSLDHTT